MKTLLYFSPYIPVIGIFVGASQGIKTIISEGDDGASLLCGVVQIVSVSYLFVKYVLA